MLEIARFDGRKRLKGALAMTVAIGALTAMYVALYPSVSASADLDQLLEAYPPALREAFDVRTLNTIEGFLATELYAFAWVILLGLYFAYAAAGLVAADVERGRMDVLLAMPVSRSRVVLEKFASLGVPLVVANTLIPLVVFASTYAVGEEIGVVDVLAAHALSIPYLLACAGIGLVASVALDRASLAQRVAAGAVFGLFLFESLVSNTEYEWVGGISPTRYYSPGDVLVDGTYDLAGSVILLAGTAALVLASREWFRRTDIE
ncbi:ABC transporter permease [Halostella sp. JP-L12]|uniref:ABC transporter permease subunit n=1 Tax=Halostella TaxID=1843185 RepID=UPI000EF84572|nr:MULTISPECIES: ABC transporter permease subunit [Halostella]NHN47655.1 ABC transporter permease [Halostella sp. JP-L12]